MKELSLPFDRQACLAEAEDCGIGEEEIE